jgi:hypothetical protein
MRSAKGMRSTPGTAEPCVPAVEKKGPGKKFPNRGATTSGAATACIAGAGTLGVGLAINAQRAASHPWLPDGSSCPEGPWSAGP